MTSGKVTAAEEYLDNLKEIDYVGVLKVASVPQPDTDPFAVSGIDVKHIGGTTPVFKRRVDNEIKKFHRGSDGTQSKKIEAQVVTGYNALEVVSPPYNLDYLAKLYEVSSPHKAAVDAKIANIVGLGYTFVESSKTKRALERLTEGKDSKKKVKNSRRRLNEAKDVLLDKLDSFNEEDEFSETLEKVWKDFETMGNGYLEIGRKKNGEIGYVGHVPAATVRIRLKRDGYVQIISNKAVFFRNFGDTKTSNPIGTDSNPNEIIHVKNYSPTSTFYGVPDIIAAQTALAGNEFAARFNLDYFENKAVPRHVVILKGAKLGSTAEAQLLQFFETGLKGQNHRTLYIPLPGDTPEEKVDLKIQPVEAGTQDSSFNNYKKQNLIEILMSHRVPITKVSVGEGVSLAVAKDADKTFKETVCGPRQKMFEKKLNRIIKTITDAFLLKLTEMTLTDEDTQSKIDERRRKTGVETANEQRARRGEPAIEGGDALFDMNAKGQASQARAEATTNRQRDSARSAGGTDSNGEGRNPQGEGRATD